MKSGIIVSEAGLYRQPWLAFTLSFFFTGLGQIYNGDLAKGLVFIMLRIFTFIFPVAVVILKNYNSYISFFAAAAGLNILVWIVSSIEAVYAARGLNVINLKKYNSMIFYIPYCFLNKALILSALYIVSLFVSIEKVSGDEMNPSFFAGEYILINKYSISKPDIGDVIFYSDAERNAAGRIIAKGGEEYRYEDGHFYINDAVLPLGILSIDEMGYLGLDTSEELFYETSGKRRYPVKVFIENNFEQEKKPKKTVSRGKNSVQIGKDMLLVSFDNRLSGNSAGITGMDSIRGRVEGVFISFNLGRLFLKPYLNN